MGVGYIGFFSFEYKDIAVASFIHEVLQTQKPPEFRFLIRPTPLAKQKQDGLRFIRAEKKTMLKWASKIEFCRQRFVPPLPEKSYEVANSDDQLEQVLAWAKQFRRVIFFYCGHMGRNGEIIVKKRSFLPKDYITWFYDIRDLVVVAEACHAGHWAKLISRKGSSSTVVLVSCGETEQSRSTRTRIRDKSNFTHPIYGRFFLAHHLDLLRSMNHEELEEFITLQIPMCIPQNFTNHLDCVKHLVSYKTKSQESKASKKDPGVPFGHHSEDHSEDILDLFDLTPKKLQDHCPMHDLEEDIEEDAQIFEEIPEIPWNNPLDPHDDCEDRWVLECFAGSKTDREFKAAYNMLVDIRLKIKDNYEWLFSQLNIDHEEVYKVCVTSCSLSDRGQDFFMALQAHRLGDKFMDETFYFYDSYFNELVERKEEVWLILEGDAAIKRFPVYHQETKEHGNDFLFLHQPSLVSPNLDMYPLDVQLCCGSTIQSRRGLTIDDFTEYHPQIDPHQMSCMRVDNETSSMRFLPSEVFPVNNILVDNVNGVRSCAWELNNYLDSSMSFRQAPNLLKFPFV